MIGIIIAIIAIIVAIYQPNFDDDNNVYNQALVLSIILNPECIGKKLQNVDGTFYVKFNY